MIDYKFTEKCPKTFRDKTSQLNGKPAYIPKVIVVMDDDSKGAYSDVLKAYIKDKVSADELDIVECITLSEFLKKIKDHNHASISDVTSESGDIIMHIVTDTEIMPLGLSMNQDGTFLELSIRGLAIFKWKCDAVMINSNHISSVDKDRVYEFIMSRSTNDRDIGTTLSQETVNRLAKRAIDAAIKKK